MKNTMDDLRNHLFATIEALQDPDKPMDVERAKAINQTAQTLINSAKVEVEFMEVSGHRVPGKFFPSSQSQAGRTAKSLSNNCPTTANFFA
jgi:tRNA(His) 5'-end guanylyltransferase